MTYKIGDMVWLKSIQQLRREGWEMDYDKEVLINTVTGSAIWQVLLNMLGKPYKVVDIHLVPQTMIELYLSDGIMQHYWFDGIMQHYWFTEDTIDDFQARDKYEKLKKIYEKSVKKERNSL